MKVSQIDTENDKNLKSFPIFKDFIHFFPSFRLTLWIGTLKRINKEGMCCPVGFSKKFNAVFQVKMSQIDTKKDKKTQNSPNF